MTENQIIESALTILESRLQKTEGSISSPQDARNYVSLKLADRKQEVFAIMFLNNRHQIIEFREMFHGTIDTAAVYPREILRAVIETNSAAVVLAHNHPSGMSDPSEADIRLTKHIVAALELINARVLDHLIVGGMDVTSMAERGQI